LVPRLALAACAALLTLLALVPAAHARSLAPGLSEHDAGEILGLAKMRWPALAGCQALRVVPVNRRVMRQAAAPDRNSGCTVLLRRDVRLSATGWCRALKPVWLRIARGSRPTAVPYDCSTVVGPLPRRFKLPSVPGLSRAVVRRAYEVATAHWPASHCRGREQVRLASNAQLLAQSSDGVVHEDAMIAGQAGMRDKRCIAYLNRDLPGWPPVALCAVLAHEFGHLAGAPHSTRPGHLMAPIDGRSNRCDAAFPPSPDLPAEPAHPAPLPETPVVVDDSGGFGGF
jgi:hypothetical protein